MSDRSLTPQTQFLRIEFDFYQYTVQFLDNTIA